MKAHSTVGSRTNAIAPSDSGVMTILPVTLGLIVTSAAIAAPGVTAIPPRTTSGFTMPALAASTAGDTATAPSTIAGSTSAPLASMADGETDRAIDTVGATVARAAPLSGR